MIKKCIGCGSILQTEDKNKEGYIDKKVIEKANYCERCFKITHYGKSSVVEKQVNITNIINNINDKNSSVIYLVDLTCLSSTTLSPLKKIKGSIYLILTKRDLLPKSVKDRKLINYIKEYFINIENIFIVSSKKTYGIESLYNKLIKDKVKEAYVLGFTNAGKSSLINSLLKIAGNTPYITTSIMPNTTIDLINIKLNNDLTLIDTPGFISDYSIFNYIDYSLYKNLVPKKEIKPKIHTLRPGFMIIISDILRIENTSLNNASLIFYMKNEIKIEKMRIERKEKLKDLKKVNIKVDENEDIVIEGLMFIKITKPAILNIYTKDEKIISTRPKMI